MADEIKKDQPAPENNEKQDQPMTLTEKIVTAILIAYVISLIWLAGSSHWFNIW